MYAQSSTSMHPTVRVGEAVGDAEEGDAEGEVVGEAVGAVLRLLIDGS